jgi:hypothetical protein
VFELVQSHSELDHENAKWFGMGDRYIPVKNVEDCRPLTREVPNGLGL